MRESKKYHKTFSLCQKSYACWVFILFLFLMQAGKAISEKLQRGLISNYSFGPHAKLCLFHWKFLLSLVVWCIAMISYSILQEIYSHGFFCIMILFVSLYK